MQFFTICYDLSIIRDYLIFKDHNSAYQEVMSNQKAI